MRIRALLILSSLQLSTFSSRQLSLRRMSAFSEPGGPLKSLLATTKFACDALKPMVSMFYSAINSDTSKMKADASVFTIADGLVQHLLVEHLFTRGKFAGIVGEEECNVNISTRPFTVDDLTVPEEFCDTVDAVAREIRELSVRISACDEYKGLTIFIDPIDGTREFSTGLGEQSSICVGFADEQGRPVAGLVYRPIPSPATWAAGAKSEGVAVCNLDITEPKSSNGLLTSNGGISKFISGLLHEGEGGLVRVPSGGAGNKMLMLLEGRGAAYIQDRGVSRWDTAAAQAVIEANGGVLCKLTSFLRDGAVEGYTYLESASNLDFEPGVAALTPYNAADKGLVKKGEAPQLAIDPNHVKPYANLCGLVALAAPAGLRGDDLNRWRERCLEAGAKSEPSYD